jgi:hypothetical protein
VALAKQLWVHATRLRQVVGEKRLERGGRTWVPALAGEKREGSGDQSCEEETEEGTHLGCRIGKEGWLLKDSEALETGGGSKRWGENTRTMAGGLYAHGAQIVWGNRS